jgi:DNA-binding NarL/FixJ family response regulator
VVTPYRIVLTDDHALVRQGLKRIIEDTNDLRVTGEADNGEELLTLLTQTPADLVILDISMPGLGGIETIRRVKAMQPHPMILVVTMHAAKQYAFEALSAGASGYLLKEDTDRQLLSAIQKIRQGGIYVSPRLADELMRHWPDAHRRPSGPATAGGRLTAREREVLTLIAKAKSSHEIAEILRISYRTVEHHRANIMAKLDVKRTAELVRYAISRGYLM